MPEIRCVSCKKLLGYVDVIQPAHTNIQCAQCKQDGKTDISQNLMNKKKWKIAKKRL